MRETRSGSLIVVAAMTLLWAAGCTELKEDVTLSGVATLDGDDAHSGIQVQVRTGQTLVTSAQTDDQGSFATRVKETDYSLTFTRAGYLTQAAIPATWAGDAFIINGGEPVVLTQDKSASIEGLLTSADPAAALGEASVALTSLLRGERRVLPVDATGGFSEVELTPGTYALSVELAGHLPHQEILTLKRDEAAALGEIALTPEALSDEAVTLRGRALLDGADAHDGVSVNVQRNGIPVATLSTTADGDFAVQASRVPYTLSFSREGYLPRENLEVVWSEEAGEFQLGGAELSQMTITLEQIPTAAVRGEVVSDRLADVDDWPSRAFVTLISADGDFVRTAPVLNGDGGRGQYQVAGLPPGAYSLNITAQGHEPWSGAVEVGADDVAMPLVTLALITDEEAVVMRGQVELDGSASAGGVLVRAFLADNLLHSTLTGDDGVFAVLTAPDDYRLALSRDGYLPRTIDVVWDDVEERFEVEDAPLEEASLRLEAVRTASLAGTVRSTPPRVFEDWPSRAFAALIKDDGEVRRIEPVADAEEGAGQFQFSGLPPGQYTLSVSARGHLSYERAVTLAEGDNPPIEVVLQPDDVDPETAVLMLGRAQLADLGADGDHSGITVRASVAGNLVATTLTADSGLFALNVSADTHTLSFSRRGYQGGITYEARWIEDDGLPQGGQFVYGAPDGDVALDAWTFELAPLNAATLTGQLNSPVAITDWPARATVVVLGTELYRVATVAANGSFSVGQLREGSYTLSAQVQGHQPWLGTVTLPTADPVEVNLTPALVSFESVVQDGAGAPVEGVVVRARQGDRLADTTLSDEQGRFRLTLTPETHTLTFSRAGYLARPEATLTWDADADVFDVDSGGEPPFVLEAQPAATFRGEVQSGDPPVSLNSWPNIAFVSLIRVDGEGQRIEPVANADGGRGQFQFAALEPGTYELNVSAQGHLPFSAQVTLASGDNTLLDALGEPVIVLSPESGDEAAVMRGQVLLQGEPAEGGDHSQILVRASVEGNLVTNATTDQTGTFAFLTSRQDHLLSFSREGFITRDVAVVWDELEERFQVEGAPLSESAFLLTQEPLGDRDADGVIDALDNCPRQPNPDQSDLDGDEEGDACDPDSDGDGLVDGLDNCPGAYNPSQEDRDGDGLGTICAEGTVARPFALGCGVTRQRLNPQRRPSALEGSCGGRDAAEYAWRVAVEETTWLRVRAQTGDEVVWYLVGALGGEQYGCEASQDARFSGSAAGGEGVVVGPGTYLLVLDGLSGDVEVTIETNLCGAPEFALADTYGVGATITFPSTSMATGDLNEDGVLDVVTVNHSANSGANLSVLYGDGEGGFAAPQSFGLGRSSLALADLDQDGHLDILSMAVSYFGGSVLYLHWGDGAGNFTQQTISLNDSSHTVAVGDINGDDLPDLVMTESYGSPNHTRNAVNVWTGDGARNFTLAERVPATYRASHHLTLRDVNMDGAVDVLASAHDSSNLMVYLNARGQGGSLLTHAGDVTGLSFARAVSVADFNNDGFLDAAVAIGFGAQSHVSISFGDGRGGMTRSILVPTCAYPVDVAVGDINADGAQDIATSCRDDGLVDVLINDGYGNFRSRERLAVGPEPHTVVLEDVNQDAALDLLVHTRGDNRVHVLLGQPRPLLTPVHNVTGRSQLNVLQDDLNGDGIPDLIAPEVSPALINIYMTDGQGYEPVRSVPTDYGPRLVTTADFNRDGHVDVAVVNQRGVEATSNVGVLLNDGEGDFTLHDDGWVPVRQTNNNGAWASASDVNGDGAPDLLFMMRSQPRGLYIMFGDGAGGFAQEALIETQADPSSAKEGDFNHDGRLDLLVETRSGVEVLLGDPDSGFVSSQFIAEAGDTTTTLLGDFNGDREVDLVTVRDQGGRVHLGGGDGTFSPAGAYTTPDVRRGAGTLADLNGDGDLDLALPGVLSKTVNVFFGDGAGNLSVLAAIPVTDGDGGQIWNVRAADFNRDGAMDLVANDRFPGSVNVLLGDGAGRFEVQAPILIGASNDQARVLELQDINRDGWMDVICNAGYLLNAQPLRRGAPSVNNADTPTCPPQRIPADVLDEGSVQWQLPAQAPCRVERVEIDLDSDGAPHLPGDLRSPRAEGDLAANPTARRVERLRPEFYGDLARFEGELLSIGDWTLQSDAAGLDSSLLINPTPIDPFTDGAAPACSAAAPRDPEPHRTCRLTGDLQGLSVGPDGEDGVLLEGPLNGAFFAGQRLQITVAPDAPAPLAVELRAFGARRPFAAVPWREEAGAYQATVTVPEAYGQRYLALHVVAGDALDVSVGYDVSVRLLEICDDGVDDNLDGQTDCADPTCADSPSCEAAVTFTCDGPAPIGALPATVTGSTVGLADHHDGSDCGPTPSPGAPEAVFAFTAPCDGAFCANTFGSGFDTILHARTTCTAPATQLLCNDDEGGGLQSQIVFSASAGETIFLYVDGFNGAGEFTLNLTAGACP